MKQPRSHPHSRCFVCSSDHPFGLRMEFRETGEGTVEGAFSCDGRWEGLAGRLHGGVVAALLDGAMSHWLLARGLEAVTADLQVRYVHPVEVEVPATVGARRRERRGSIHEMEAWLIQDGQLRARAHARFLEEERPAERGVPWP